MSGTQSTITDRFPLKKPTRHGSILSRESPADKKQKVERCSSTHDFDPTDSSSKKTKSSSEESRSETYGKLKQLLQPCTFAVCSMLSVCVPKAFILYMICMVGSAAGSGRLGLNVAISL
uniref:Rho guanine nucleotide exchange factor 12 n=1 Tax=Accipiter nisus TaxID=211598 RepID=A0A8B9MZG8_9AVES